MTLLLRCCDAAGGRKGRAMTYPWSSSGTRAAGMERHRPAVTASMMTMTMMARPPCRMKKPAPRVYQAVSPSKRCCIRLSRRGGALWAGLVSNAHKAGGRVRGDKPGRTHQAEKEREEGRWGKRVGEK